MLFFIVPQEHEMCIKKIISEKKLYALLDTFVYSFVPFLLTTITSMLTNGR